MMCTASGLCKFADFVNFDLYADCIVGLYHIAHCGTEVTGCASKMRLR